MPRSTSVRYRECVSQTSSLSFSGGAKRRPENPESFVRMAPFWVLGSHFERPRMTTSDIAPQ
jgi:hypothetical protein